MRAKPSFGVAKSKIPALGYGMPYAAVEYLDLAFRLAESHGIVLLNGGGFDALEWSLRTLANLPDETYEDIGRTVWAVARGYRDAFEASQATSVSTKRLVMKEPAE